ncbi:MAG: 2OG-Fe(II) oxygenase [Gomphosphaeria aponina SAG 52.96 = DSM 107014]|uniref:2OG-Fe(II) oxygenase n=1 Tax=Gomphosphaeria aponina SAG 52.96 = DSM 107014 TaxID=1521640 RepID=A0A941JLP2_9CHRO|nr:2OG-Fe(II) oxygenase [Gomphosphaeria aponina SAG 52.96 = DSM 107014]
MTRRIFTVGDPAPWFSCRSSNSSEFHFGTTAGRYLVLCFYGSASIRKNARVINYLTKELRHFFDDEKIAFFGVSIDNQDEQLARVSQILPGIRYFWDFNGQVSLLYGAIAPEQELTQGQIAYNSFTLVLSPLLRVMANIPLTDPDRHNETISKILSELPPVNDYAGVPLHAPVLIVPRIFERSFCRQLIELYEKNGGSESGFMREKDGNTVGVVDYSFKRRQDYYLDHDSVNDEICAAIRAKIVRRLVPEIEKAYQYKVTRMERYVIACYDGEIGGFFRPHRDNTTKGTAHRRFACTINLNTEEYEGGDLRFPEFGRATYRAPTGGAVVFSCSLLHEATPVTKGTRYAFLPFLYDDESAQIRQENSVFLTGEIIRS